MEVLMKSWTLIIVLIPWTLLLDGGVCLEAWAYYCEAVLYCCWFWTLWSTPKLVPPACLPSYHRCLGNPPPPPPCTKTVLITNSMKNIFCSFFLVIHLLTILQTKNQSSRMELLFLLWELNTSFLLYTSSLLARSMQSLIMTWKWTVNEHLLLWSLS